jgi:hypothetical protein
MSALLGNEKGQNVCLEGDSCREEKAKLFVEPIEPGVS